jgi:Fe-S-cluster-containing hydrogenase component 2
MSKTAPVRTTRIHWDKRTCTDCVSCVVVCAEDHTGTSAPSRSRIRILVDVLGADHDAEYCRQCGKAPCAGACPEDAIRFDDGLRIWLVDEDRCTGCGDCVEVCPFNAVHIDPIVGLATMCDLCLGAARCVAVCPTNALIVRGQTGMVGQ